MLSLAKLAMPCLTVETTSTCLAGHFVGSDDVPETDQRLDAHVCWMDSAELQVGRPYILVQTTRSVQAIVSHVDYRVMIDTLQHEEAPTLTMNDIGRLEITTAAPVVVEPYSSQPATGCFILVDPRSNATVARE